MNILNRSGLGSSGQNSMYPSPIAQGNDVDTPSLGSQFAQFGAGCFWGVELAFQRVPGVTQTEVGYTQGSIHNPSYEDVCSGTTSHAEVVRVQYDTNNCSYESLLDLFWSRHDPTTLNRQVCKPLSWGLRLRIAIGVARALDYLHSSFCPPIAHSDLKATNILLDEELTPRIADCGLASLRPLTSNSVKLRASEIAIQNTGYIAPEHGQPGSSGTKSDTYALGVLLLELLTGRKAFDSSRPRGEQLLVKWASTRLHDRRSIKEESLHGITKKGRNSQS